MTNEELHIRMMEYLYGELDESDRRKFEAYLQEHPSAKKEVEELRKTGSVLKGAEAGQPKHHFTVAPAPVQPVKKWWQYKSIRVAAAAAACMILFFTAGAITGLKVDISRERFSLTFGNEPEQPTMFTAGQVQQIISKVQQQNLQTMNELISASELQQQAKIEESLSTFMDYMDTQRQEDFRLISEGLKQLQDKTSNRFARNELVLGELFQKINIQN